MRPRCSATPDPRAAPRGPTASTPPGTPRGSPGALRRCPRRCAANRDRARSWSPPRRAAGTPPWVPPTSARSSRPLPRRSEPAADGRGAVHAAGGARGERRPKACAGANSPRRPMTRGARRVRPGGSRSDPRGRGPRKRPPSPRRSACGGGWGHGIRPDGAGGSNLRWEHRPRRGPGLGPARPRGREGRASGGRPEPRAWAAGWRSVPAGEDC